MAFHIGIPEYKQLVGNARTDAFLRDFPAINSSLSRYQAEHMPGEGSFESWRDNGIQRAIDIVPVSPREYIIEPINVADYKQTAASHISWPLNEMGIGFSKNANTNQGLRELFYRKYGLNTTTADFLDIAKGPYTYNIVEIGVADLKGAAAAVQYIGDYKYRLLVDVDFYKKSAERAKALSKKAGHREIDLFKKSILKHELGHINGIYQEEVLGAMLYRHYKNLADNAKTLEERGRFLDIAMWHAHYALAYRASMDTLLSKFKAEAKYLSLKGDEREEYIANRIQSYLKNKNNGKKGNREREKISDEECLEEKVNHFLKEKNDNPEEDGKNPESEESGEECSKADNGPEGEASE